MKKILDKIKNLTKVQKIVAILAAVVVVASITLLCVVNAYMDKINFIEDPFDYITDETLKSELDIGTIIGSLTDDTEESSSDNTTEDVIIESTVEPTETPSTSTEEPTTTPEPTEPPKLPDFQEKEGIINILLIGADRQGTRGYGRSDCTIIASLNTNDKTIKMASILRDSYVSIPGYSKNKINASYAFGGPDLLMETIELNFGIKLEKYVYVDFEEFTSIINALDGVDIELTKKETSKVFGTEKPAGTYHLNGAEALKFVRIRKIDSDVNRTGRQRELLMSLYNEYKSKSLTEALSIATDLLPLVNTNLTKSEIIDLITVAVQIGNLDFEEHTLPKKGTYQTGYTDKGAWIIDMDFEKNSQLLYEFIYGE